jgi:hypothetical protein
MCLLFVSVGWIDGWMDRDDVGSFDVMFNLFNHPVFHHGSIALFTFLQRLMMSIECWVVLPLGIAQ